MLKFEEEFPNLCQLMGCYFHQDWDLTGPDTESVLAEYARVTPVNRMSLARAEIARLLSRGTDESELARDLDALGSYYYPGGDGITYVEWLRKVADCLTKHIDNQTK